jgi:ribonuclease BN (tRNA processing enzyme)
MEVVFLGTNGWYDTDTGNTICTLINSEKCHVIMDAGNGIYKASRYIRDDKPAYLFISHFHIDHIEGLHILNKFRFEQGLRIYGQKGTKKVLETFVNEPFTVPLNKLPFHFELHELSEGPYKIPFPVDCRFLVHASPCMGYRFELDGKTVAYCPDTGVCDSAVKLAENVDLLIAECSHKPGEHSPDWPHLNPEDAATIAKRAKAKRLALTHFDAGRYETIQERLDAARSILDFEEIVVARDNMILQL